VFACPAILRVHSGWEFTTLQTLEIPPKPTKRTGFRLGARSSCAKDVGVTNDEVAELFVQSGALLRGHFVLTSGRHSDQYFEKFDVLRWPEHVATLGAELAARVRASAIEATVVLGPTTLGIVLAYELGRQLGLPAAYGEKNAEGQRFVRRADHLTAQDRVLIVDDILTTGGSIRECQLLVDSVGAQTVGAAVLVDRANGKLDLGVPLVSALAVDVQSWEADALPEWLAAIPVTRPGSTGKK
jgi:orotate phosphoribosyltransferase